MDKEGKGVRTGDGRRHVARATHGSLRAEMLYSTKGQIRGRTLNYGLAKSSQLSHLNSVWFRSTLLDSLEVKSRLRGLCLSEFH